MTPATLAIERTRRGPPALVTYLPAFWMLVPGAAGLIGITEIVGTDSTLGPTDFLEMLSTVIEISLGVLIGASVFHATVEGVPEIARTRAVSRDGGIGAPADSRHGPPVTARVGPALRPHRSPDARSGLPSDRHDARPSPCAPRSRWRRSAPTALRRGVQPGRRRRSSTRG